MKENAERDVMHAARASKGGAARMRNMSKPERAALASKAAKARWAKPVPGESASKAYETIILNAENTTLPVAKWPGMLTIGDFEVPVYVLDDRRRIVSRTGATTILTVGKGGGDLEGYIQVKALERYMPPTIQDRMIEFVIPGVVNKAVKGMTAETFLEICGAYVRAWQEGAIDSESQVAIAKRAITFLAACSKIGLIALIDEASGYQYRRAEEELQLKLRAFLLEEMRKWERTFPNELWEQFGRLTNWTGSLNQRPKYWGKLVMELIYEYLDPDVAQWLRENAPAPKHGQNYHQWLTDQYGLKRLIEHIWKVIGIASTCDDGCMADLKYKMEQLYGRKPGFQYAFRIVPTERQLTE